MLETPDRHGRLELMKLHAPLARCGDGHATPNTLGIRRVTFAVDDIDAAVAGLQARGAELLGRVVRHEDSHRLCYVGGPEGIIVMLAEQNRLRPRPVANGLPTGVSRRSWGEALGTTAHPVHAAGHEHRAARSARREFG